MRRQRHQRLANALIEATAIDVGLKVAPLDNRLRVLRRGPYSIALNYNDISIEAPSPTDARFIIGNRTIEAAGVTVWDDQ